MDITKLFDELRMIPDVEVVVALLPEVLRLGKQAVRHVLLQRFEGIG
jgi:hypothetical protein